jgi:hypothetical protein
MPGIYKATAWFECNGLGWSEAYYRDSGLVSDLAALADFDRVGAGGAGGLWVKRAGCCGREVTLVAQETSFISVRGDSVLNYIPIGGNSAFSADAPTVALLVSCGNLDNTRRKNVFMRGIADNVVVNGGRFAAGTEPAFEAAINNFKNTLISDGYGWLGRQAPQIFDVTAWADVPATHQILLTVDVGPLPPADTFGLVRLVGKLMNPRGRSVLDGVQVYIRVSDTEVKTKKPTAVFPFPGPGPKLIFKPTDLIDIASVRFQKIVERKVGKASHLPRGRALARARG